MKKTIIVVFLFCLAVSAQAAQAVDGYDIEHREVINDANLQDSAQYGDYRVKIYRSQDPGTFGILQIFKYSDVVFEAEGYKFSLGASDGDLRLDHSPPIGQDITGDSEPNLVVSHWSGGAHCCFDVYVFSIGHDFRLIDKIEGAHGFVGFDDLNADGILEFVAFDWTFAYWYESFAGSPAPRVVLGYTSEGYQPDLVLMKRPLADLKKEYQEWAADDYYSQGCTNKYFWWKKDDVCVSTPVWAHMLDLIYGGYPQRAWTFLDEVWEGREELKGDFIAEFKQQLGQSPYAEWLPLDLKVYSSEEKQRLEYLRKSRKAEQ